MEARLNKAVKILRLMNMQHDIKIEYFSGGARRCAAFEAELSHRWLSVAV